MMSTGPKCQVCGAEQRVEFRLQPLTTGYKFGQICVPCDDMKHGLE